MLPFKLSSRLIVQNTQVLTIYSLQIPNAKQGDINWKMYKFDFASKKYLQLSIKLG